MPHDLDLDQSSTGMSQVRQLNPLGYPLLTVIPMFVLWTRFPHTYAKPTPASSPTNMDVQGPPVHYPNAHESTNAVYRTRESTPAGSPPATPQYQLPAYDSPPPQYQEEESLETKLKKDGRRTVCIRLMTSIFIVTIVALIVAAVFGRINNVRSKKTTELEDGKFVIPTFFPW